MKKKTLGIYQSTICEVGGVESFLYNFCFWLRNFFDITIVYINANPSQLYRLQKIVKIVNYKDKEKFEFDIVIRNSVWGEICDKIYSKENRYIEMRHANYKYLLDEGLLYKQYHEWSRTNEIVGCGEYVSKMSDLVLHDKPTTIRNILLPRKKTNKVLHLISCTRLDPAKGWNRMLKMAQMMRDAGIKFTWDIFTNSTNYIKENKFEEIHFWKQRYDIWDYLASADYTVLLSDSEGMPYTVQESLQYQVPCIVTDVGGCTELIKDGVNGYVVPLDMDFDINKITKIPKCKEYDNEALEKWLQFLNYDIKKDDLKKVINDISNGEEKEMLVKVRCIMKNGYDDIELGKHIDLNKEYIVKENRAEYLRQNHAIEIIEFIQEEEKPKKKTTKKTSKK